MTSFKEVAVNSPNLSWVIVNSFFIDYTPATVSLKRGDVLVLVDKWEKRGRPWVIFIYEYENSLYFEKKGDSYFVNGRKYGIDFASEIDKKHLTKQREDRIISLTQKAIFSQKNIDFLNELKPSLQIFSSQIATEE